MQAGGGDPAHDTELEQEDLDVSSHKAAVFPAFVVQLPAALQLKYAFLLRITVIIKTAVTIAQSVAMFYSPLLPDCDTVTSNGSRSHHPAVGEKARV